MRLEPFCIVPLHQPVGQLRAAPLSTGLGDLPAVIVAYAADYDVDPYHEMFFFPTDTLKLAAITTRGDVLWRRDLGRGVVPGIWFCPVLPFDLDGDGSDEIWFVDNVDAAHPLSLRGRRLERLDARTGETTGQWPWPRVEKRTGETPSHMFREFLIAGRGAGGTRVLVTAQGTYTTMTLQGWNADMSPRWDVVIPVDAPGARGSHMCPVVDINDDGIDELMWGERCLSLDDGRELFCCDRDSYRGHSDMVQPVLDRASGAWSIYTFREGDVNVSPRVAAFDATGRRTWGAVDRGHMDMGCVATLSPDAGQTATTIRIGFKGSGAAGHVHTGRDEFAFDARTGRPVELPFSTYQTLPVDLNGDGVHELVRGLYAGDGTVLDGRTGATLGTVGGHVSLACKFADHPGEQVLTIGPDGTIRMWADRDAVDSPEALRRYAHPFYRANRRLGASGFNIHALGGI